MQSKRHFELELRPFRLEQNVRTICKMYVLFTQLYVLYDTIIALYRNFKIYLYIHISNNKEKNNLSYRIIHLFSRKTKKTTIM